MVCKQDIMARIYKYRNNYFMFKKIISFGLLTESLKVPTRLGNNRSPLTNHLSAIHRKILSPISEKNRNYPHKN